MSKRFEFMVSVPMIDVFSWEIEGPEDATGEELQALGRFLNTLGEEDEYPVKFGRFTIVDYLGDEMDTTLEDPSFVIANYDTTPHSVTVLEYGDSDNE